MTTEQVKQLIAKGEGIEVEFKESYNSLARSVYETICAFLNRRGGHILLGVKDDKTITGVNEASIPAQLDTLAKDMNNPQIITPTFYLATEVIDIDGKKIIYIYVPESSQPHSYKGNIYDRNEDGDFKLSNPLRVTDLYIRKQECYTENKVFPYLDMSDFEDEQFELAKKLIKTNRIDHPWGNMTNEEILKSARMKLKDVHTGKEGYTLAAALLFGKENTLASVLPHYKTDALCRIQDTELYDDRDDIRCNLMGAYYRLLAFIHKYLPERPFLEGTQRISLRDMIFREVVANLLVHREFSNAFPATLTIYKDSVVTKNWNRPYMNGRINLDNLNPHPKNPTIANFFRQLGWVEELGSGIRRMYKYCPLYLKNSTPVIEEGDVFKLMIQYNPINEGVNEGLNQGGGVNGGVNQGGGVNGGVNQGGGVNSKEGLLEIITKTGGLNVTELAERIKLSIRTVERHIRSLKLEGKIEFRGAPKTGGYYKI